MDQIFITLCSAIQVFFSVLVASVDHSLVLFDIALTVQLSVTPPLVTQLLKSSTPAEERGPPLQPQGEAPRIPWSWDSQGCTHCLKLCWG